MNPIEKKKCPVCDLLLIKMNAGAIYDYDCECSVCGEFSVTQKYAYKDLPENAHLIQGALRERQLKGLSTTLLTANSDAKQEGIHFTEKELLESVKIPQNPTQKIDRFLANLETLSKGNYSKMHIVDIKNDYPLCYGRDPDELNWIWKTMKDEGYFRDISSDTLEYFKFQLSIKAWDKIEALKKGNKKSDQGFIACKFKDHDSCIEAMVTGIKNAKFEPMVIKDKDYPETIFEKALGEIRKSRFVVADLTDQRKSVIYEIGFARGLGIDIILVVNKDDWDKSEEKEKEKMEFYVSHYNIKQYKDETDLANIVEQAVRARIESR